MTYKDLDIITNAVCFAYGRLTRDGVNMSDDNWRDMMQRLERAYRISHEAAAKREPCTLHLNDNDHPWEN